MTIWERLDQMNLSRYQLARACGLSWAEVSGLCMGKQPLPQCGDETLEKLAQAMGLSRQELLELETGPQALALNPESGLPGFVQQSIDNLLQGELEQVSHLDCLYDDLYGSINAAQWGGDITREQADYLRKKYLFSGDEEDI